MTGNALQNIERAGSSLWETADQLRADSKLASSSCAIPVLSVSYLRHAANRYFVSMAAIEAEQTAGKMSKHPLVKADFVKRWQYDAPLDEGIADIVDPCSFGQVEP